jgi:alkanesulfonate monooxygenase SsuD/methylene tetrahydromethanopterin reductase-like flavin-dependent oxidoreductase (luciferase family)
VRFAQLAEVIDICRLMWTDPDPSYQGKYFQIDGAAASPLPEVVPPICIGASGEQIGLPLVGRLADIWNGSSRGTDDDWRRRVDIVQTAAVAAGRDPADIEISTTLERSLPENDVQAAELLELLAHKAELGVQHFVMDFGHPPTDEHVLRFAEQVISPLRAQHAS